jgi:hypothetical protein
MAKPSGGFFGANAFMDSFMNARQHGDVSALREAQLKAWQDQQELDKVIQRGSPHLGGRIGAGVGGGASVDGGGYGGAGAPGGGQPPTPPPIQPRQPSPPSAAAYGVPSSNPQGYGTPAPSGGYQPSPDEAFMTNRGLGVGPTDYQFAQGPNAPAPVQGVGPMPQSPMRSMVGPEMGQGQAQPVPPMQGMAGPEMGNRQPPQPQPPMQSGQGPIFDMNAGNQTQQMVYKFLHWLQSQGGQNGAGMYSGAPGTY